MKKVEKTCIFIKKWLDHLLLITSYLLTIVNTLNLSLDDDVSKRARRINEQLQKTSSADVLSPRKKNQKALFALANATVSKPFRTSSSRKLGKELAPTFAENNSFGDACFAEYATVMTNNFTVKWLARG